MRRKIEESNIFYQFKIFWYDINVIRVIYILNSIIVLLDYDNENLGKEQIRDILIGLYYSPQSPDTVYTV